MYPQVYSNRKLVQGLLVYASRLKGELVRADRELGAKTAARDAVLERQRYYGELLDAVRAVGVSLAPDENWQEVKPKVTLLEDYRTQPGDLKAEILKQLKQRAEPISVNNLHERIIGTMGLKFSTKSEQKHHRAVVVDALHDMRKGPPSLVDCTQEGRFGHGRSREEQRWFLKQLRPSPPSGR